MVSKPGVNFVHGIRDLGCSLLLENGMRGRRGGEGLLQPISAPVPGMGRIHIATDFLFLSTELLSLEMKSELWFGILYLSHY